MFFFLTVKCVGLYYTFSCVTYLGMKYLKSVGMGLPKKDHSLKK